VDQYWYYWNSTGRDKLAIVMYGGLAWVPDRVYVYSLFTQDAIGEKEKLIYDLQENGYDVLSPWHDKVYQNITEYNGTKDWVYDATVWAIQNGYH
ncbi:MAG: hypothetical protein QHH20_06745, partial [Candidatus Bathyarchaeota archaeon]|nr:hypothetical protein [Candidatus Bathyarchaeota archaeon]